MTKPKLLQPSSVPVLSPMASSTITHHASKIGYLFFNFISSVAITFINDAVFSKAEFGYPAMLCLNGFVATFIGTEIMRWFSLVEPMKHSPAPSLKDPNFLILVVVVGLSKTLNNASLKYNSMGFYQIFKLLVTPLVVLLEYGLNGKTLSIRRTMALFMVCVFVYFSVQGDLEFSAVGTAWAVLWVPFAAIYKVLWGKVKTMYNCSTLALMHAVMPYAIVLQIFISPLVDPPGIRNYHWTAETVVLLSMSGFGAFFVSFSGFLVMGNVGALAHTLLGPMKTAVTMVGAYLLLQTHFSPMQLFAAAGALISLMAYTHITIREKDQEIQVVAPSNALVHRHHHHQLHQIHQDDPDIELSVTHNHGN
jgi:solute carrier family 35 protein E3